MTAVVTTTRPIDFIQLTQELGTPEDPASMSISDDGTERTITAHDEDVTEEELQAAVDAHVPNEEVQLSIEERLTIAQQEIQAHQELIDALILELLG